MKRFPSLLLALCSVTGLSAQQTQPSQQPQAPQQTQQPVPFTVEDAIALALRNNPEYLQAVNQRRSAVAARRAAMGGLLPQLSANLTGQYQQGGRQIMSGTELGANADVLQSSYSIGLTYHLNRATFLTPRVERANAEAIESDIAGATEALRAMIRQSYLNVLQSQARLALQDSLVASAQAQLELAKGRAAVGAGTQLDAQRAEVALGQQRVQRLQAQNQLEIDKLTLFQQIGLSQPGYVTFTSTFTISDNIPTLHELLEMAKRQNPNLSALRSRERAASLNVSRARSDYLPSFSLSTGIGGYTFQYRDSEFPVNQQRAQIEASRASCLRTEEVRRELGLPNSYDACNQIAFTPQMAASIRSANSAFPFNFTNAPRSISAQLSLPLFDGFSREQRVQEAVVQRENARHAARARELAVMNDVTTAYLRLQTARQTVTLQEQNAAAAREELTLTQEQYAVGLATFVDVATSRATYAQAESDRINAIYEYHKAFAALENALGRSLR
jgi:outer membrane protein